MQTFYLESLSFTVSDSTGLPQSRFNKGLWISYWKYLFGHWPLKQIQFIQLLIQTAFQLLSTQIPFCRGLPSLTELFKPLYHTSLHKTVIDLHLQGRAFQVSPEGTRCHHLQWFKYVISMEPTGNPRLHVNIHFFSTASKSPAFRHLRQVDLDRQNKCIKPTPLALFSTTDSVPSSLGTEVLTPQHSVFPRFACVTHKTLQAQFLEMDCQFCKCPRLSPSTQ